MCLRLRSAHAACHKLLNQLAIAEAVGILPVAGRGAAMAATASNIDQRHQCKAYGHFERDCPQLVKKSRSKRGKDVKMWTLQSISVYLILSHYL